MTADAGARVPPLVPARMLNEHAYCPRLAYLEWVDQRFVDSGDTARGSRDHRRVDAARGSPPSPDAAGAERPSSTAVEIGSERLGIVARIDLLESDGDSVVPIEYKTGAPRDGPAVLWPPEQIQLCAQVLLLRDAGYRVDRAQVWFAATRTRHDVPIDDDLIDQTLQVLAQLRETAARDEPPAPLVDSPKCPRCSLVGLCLPDELNLLNERATRSPRRLVASDPAAQPLYASTPGARLTKRGGRVVLIEDRKEVATRRLLDISHIAVFGNVDVSSALVRECFDAGVAVLWFTHGGWFSGYAQGMPAKNVAVRMRQHRAAAIGAATLARTFVTGKIRNQRTLLRRHGGADAAPALAQLAALARQAQTTGDLASLLGVEGTAARIYFSRLPSLLRHSKQLQPAMTFEGRNRRPPTDPVNALLSFCYAMLVKDCVVALLAVGLDPYVGMYHQPRFGRPALALDLAEEFRPLIGDSVVLTVVNNGEIATTDFVTRARGVALTNAGRRKVIAAYERRMRSELTHPLFRYRASYRRSLEIQARLLAAVLIGDIDTYRPLTTR
jgi:CRISPR-associated protein Cas1